MGLGVNAVFFFESHEGTPKSSKSWMTIRMTVLVLKTMVMTGDSLS